MENETITLEQIIECLKLWSDKFGNQTRIVLYDDESGHIQASNKSEWGVPNDDCRVFSFSSLQELLSAPIEEE